MLIVDVNSFLCSVKTFADDRGFCPRCGQSDSVYPTSFFSGVNLCCECFLDENIKRFEEYDNWAVVCAVRAVCDTDIKICKECVSDVTYCDRCSQNQF